MDTAANTSIEHPAVSPPGGGPRIDGDRLLRSLDAISVFTTRPGPGITRTGLSPEEAAARTHLADRYGRDGVVAETDAAGNLILRRHGADPKRPTVLFGSHLDTVVHGGRLDGTYGVIAACEVLRTLTRLELDLQNEPVAVAFSNEEGARFPCPFFGSLAMTGQLDVGVTAMTDQDGVSLASALRDAGGDPDHLASAAWPEGSIVAYLEPHIEQGPVLEAKDVPIGVVDAITGRTIVDIVVSGQQGHAGTTPMAPRRDALVAAAQVVLLVERLSTELGLCAVSTVGCVAAEPNVTNVIPGMVRLTAEIRDARTERLRVAEQALVRELTAIAANTGTHIEARPRQVARPTDTDPLLRDAIGAAAGDLGLLWIGMFSGAGHDAQIMAKIAPVGMIFVPSRDGISHAPQEHTDDVHLVAGADTLLRTVLLTTTGVGR